MAASEPRPVLLQKVHYGLPQVKLGPNRDLRRHTACDDHVLLGNDL